MLSENLKFSSGEIESWLENETRSVFAPVHAKAEKLRDDMDKALKSLSEASKMLLDNSGKEIEKRNMKIYGRARALNKLARLFVERIGKLNSPDQVSYESLSKFAQETQKNLVVIEIDIRNWFPRISPFFILDRRRFSAVYEKSKETLKMLNDFIANEYVKTKTLEETFQLIERLQSLEKQASELKERKAKIESEKAIVEKEIVDSRQKLDALTSKSALGELDQINSERGELIKEVKHRLRHLQKPFKKVQALALHGGGAGLTQDELNKLSQYLESPFDALATEEADYPMLREILEKMSRLMSEDKLKLKSDKARKAEQAVDNILNKNSLKNLHQKCAEVKTQKKQLLTSTEMEETKREFSKLQEEIERLEIRRKSIETHKKTEENSYNETIEKIKSDKNEIEKNIISFLGKKVQVA